MKNRNHAYRAGDILLTGMTKREADTLHQIMKEREIPPSITLLEYIEKFNPRTRRWKSKNGNEMVAAEVLDVVAYMSVGEEIVQQLRTAKYYKIFLKKEVI